MTKSGFRLVFSESIPLPYLFIWAPSPYLQVLTPEGLWSASNSKRNTGIPCHDADGSSGHAHLRTQVSQYQGTPAVSTCRATACPLQLGALGQATAVHLSRTISLLLRKPKLRLRHHKCVPIFRRPMFHFSTTIPPVCLAASQVIRFYHNLQ